jgi:hypothetical protein
MHALPLRRSSHLQGTNRPQPPPTAANRRPAPQVDHLCEEAKTKLRGTAAVLKCLIQKFDEANNMCQAGCVSPGPTSTGPS